MKKWKEETRYLSSIHEIVMHPAYQQIIGMGKEALPYLLNELRWRPDNWFLALKIITGEDPVPPEEKGNIFAMAQRWVRWGAMKGWVH
jgi:hypothetical protein